MTRHKARNALDFVAWVSAARPTARTYEMVGCADPPYVAPWPSSVSGPCGSWRLASTCEYRWKPGVGPGVVSPCIPDPGSGVIQVEHLSKQFLDYQRGW